MSEVLIALHQTMIILDNKELLLKESNQLLDRRKMLDSKTGLLWDVKYLADDGSLIISNKFKERRITRWD